jgi:hypothetical protein
MPLIDDLLIIADPGADFFDVIRQSGSQGTIEVRLDRRRGQRRGSGESPLGEERRRSDRRMRDVTAALQTVGWAIVPASERTG